MASALLCNKYVLLDRIGSGGMAEVFLAKQVGISGFEKLVVIKRILPQFAKKDLYVQMFLDEAKIAADLRHPNIVSTIEVAKDKGCYLMVMEYLHGLDLRFILRRLAAKNEIIPLELAVGVAIEVLAGLHYAHNKKSLDGQTLKIVHRDVSPQNIVLTFEGETKIVDFGIAHTRHQKQESKGVLRGKFSYMSPEQAGGKELDHRSDQMSLAIVLYELTTGKRLFKKESEALTIASALACKIPLPSQIVSHYPKMLETILLRALSKNADERYADCDEFRIALQDFLGKQGSVFERTVLGKFLRQHFGSYDKPDRDLSGTYFCRNTNSEFSKSRRLNNLRKWKFSPVLALFLFVVTASVALGIFFLSSAGQIAKKTIAISHEQTAQNLQSIGLPQLSEESDDTSRVLPQKEKSFGRLKIAVDPWGEVFVDGASLGLTPLAPRRIAEGKHTVRIVNSRLAKEKTIQVEIHAHKDTLVRYQF